MHKASILFMSLSLLMILSCTSVVSIKPVGEEDTAAVCIFEGNWEHDGSIIHIRPIEGGKLTGAGVEWRDKKFQLQTMDLVVTKIGDIRIINISVEENRQKQAWYFARYTFDEDAETLVIYPPVVKAFERAIDSGMLAGTVEKDKEFADIILEGNKPDLKDFFSKENSAPYFNMKDVMILKRIGKRKQSK